MNQIIIIFYFQHCKKINDMPYWSLVEDLEFVTFHMLRSKSSYKAYIFWIVGEISKDYSILI